ncbi:BTAD domain-containing putative transcriptional regulator [Actinomadura parmotrematis]|uniref:BTAD domain-containing putative transcriptional regulator n=1 Tax=Actinomadura parmotrematis TaxID=2864039 RepID=UPI0027E3ACA5|nr:BTAD domain-containing putative transcriptional regulator [Actinomadura parmotrematis]
MPHVRVLGSVGADLHGRPVPLGAARQRALLARLAAAGGRVVSTDRLIEDLWDGAPPPKALAALQVHVSNLRRALEPGRAPRTPAAVVVTAPPGYRLALPADRVDAWRLRALAAAAVEALGAERHGAALALLDEAAALWTGDPYGEFAGQAWAAADAAELAELRLRIVEHRARALLGAGRAADAVPGLERLTREHPLREDPAGLLALAYYRTGRQGDALAALRGTRRALADELGVDPGPRLRELETAILRQEPPVPAVPGPEPRRGPVGRDAELARLAAAAREARAGALRVVWLGGEAGSGKSALAEEIAVRLAGDGWRVAVGRCPETDDGAPPAWAWSEILRALDPDAALRARLAPLLDGGAAPGGQFELGRAVAAALAAAAPLLVVLEDVHRADQETLHLLRQAAGQVAASAVLLVVTHRPDPSGELGATLAALAGRGAVHLPLPPLDRAAVGALLAAASGAEPDAATVALVADRTGGNPLFVVETARLLAAAGPEAAGGLPPGVRDLIRARLGRLPAPARTVLRDAAVIGRDVDVDLLVALHGAEDEVLDGLEAGVLTGLLTEPAPGRVRFAHVLVRDALYEDIPRLRRGRLHGRVLAALERLRPGDATALGHHALASASTATARRAAEYAAGAAARAAALYAHREAAALLEGALGALDLAADGDGALRLRLLCGLVSARAHAGDVVGALRSRATALETARRAGGADAVTAALTAFDAPVTWTIQPDRRQDRVIVAALEDALASASGADRCRLLAALTFEIEGHDDARAADAAAEAVAIARGLGDSRLP